MVRWCADAVAGLPCRSYLIDGEAVACDDQGTPVFKLLIRNRLYASAQLYAFDLLELDGEDLRGGPIERRKDALTQVLSLAEDEEPDCASSPSRGIGSLE
jgi:bifunctional non-homologous end joining protein LigD